MSGWRAAGWVVGAGVVFAAALVLRAPPERLLRPLAQSPAALRWEAVEGTALHGAARALRVRGLAVDSLGWRLAPAALLRACLGWVVTAADPALALSGRVAACPGGISVRDLTGRVRRPAALAASLGWPVEVSGVVEVDVRRLRLASGSLRYLQASLRWQGAGVRLERDQPLGTLAIEARVRAGVLEARLRQLEGSLGLQGRLEGPLDGTLTYRLSAHEAAVDAPLRRWLDALGPPRVGGGRLVLEGRLGTSTR